MSTWRAISRRMLEPERMDDPRLDRRRHYQALRGLERLNRASRSVRLVWEPLRDLAERGPNGAGRLWSVLDVGTGAGDLPIALYQRARARGVCLAVHACDLSGRAIAYARWRARRARVAVHFFPWDALRGPLPERYDLVTCSLVVHHLTELQAVRLLTAMGDGARRMVVVSDLERGLPGWTIAWLFSRLLSRSPVVRFDGPQSVRAAFTAAELGALAQQAGLRGARVERRWPRRIQLIWERP